MALGATSPRRPPGRVVRDVISRPCFPLCNFVASSMDPEMFSPAMGDGRRRGDRANEHPDFNCMNIVGFVRAGRSVVDVLLIRGVGRSDGFPFQLRVSALEKELGTP